MEQILGGVKIFQVDLRYEKKSQNFKGSENISNLVMKSFFVECSCNRIIVILNKTDDLFNIQNGQLTRYYDYINPRDIFKDLINIRKLVHSLSSFHDQILKS